MAANAKPSLKLPVKSSMFTLLYPEHLCLHHDRRASLPEVPIDDLHEISETKVFQIRIVTQDSTTQPKIRGRKKTGRSGLISRRNEDDR